MQFSSLLEAVESAIGAASWLGDADVAGVELARKYAQLIDDSVDSGEWADQAKAFAVAGPNLQKTLTSLGLNPEARKELDAQGKVAEVDPIDELKERRRRALGKKTAG